jgi:hypothetical protein
MHQRTAENPPLKARNGSQFTAALNVGCFSTAQLTWSLQACSLSCCSSTGNTAVTAGPTCCSRTAGGADAIAYSMLDRERGCRLLRTEGASRCSSVRLYTAVWQGFQARRNQTGQDTPRMGQCQGQPEYMQYLS